MLQTIKTRNGRIGAELPTPSDSSSNIDLDDGMKGQTWKKESKDPGINYVTSVQPAYKVLGLRPGEPTTRPPILERTAKTVPSIN